MKGVREFSGGVPESIADTVSAWMDWRAKVPVRGNYGEGPTNLLGVSSKPGKGTQEPWASYAMKTQLWLFVPFLVERGEEKTQPLAGAPVEAELMQVVHAGKIFEHYTNIHRIRRLAETHPLVAAVREHQGHDDDDDDDE